MTLPVHPLVRLKVIALASMSLLAVGQVYAETVPDAGSLLREIERQQVRPIPKAVPKSDVKKEQGAPKAEASILVKEFRFEGNERISTNDLQSHYSKYLNQTLTFSELQNIAAEIALIYSSKGLVAQGQLPRQDVTNGVVTIRIVEARFGGSVFDEEQKKQLTLVQPDVIARIVQEGQIAGQLVNTVNLDRALLIADDLPGVVVQGGLMPGEREGETLVLIQAKDERQFSADLSVDNQGSRSTGAFKKSANLSMASPAGVGDLVSVSLLNSQGTDYGRVSYSLPLDASGLRAGINASHMRYEVITPESQSTKPKGVSDVFGFDIQYPLIRSASRNLYVNSAYDIKHFKNERIATSSYETQSAYRLNVLSLGLSGNQYDGYLGGGYLSGSVNVGFGAVNLEGSPNQSDDASSVRTSGEFSRLRWNVSRQQNLLEDFSFLLTFSGQMASKNLDSSEKFYLGGVSGIRAYPSSEGAGSEGQMINVEFRQRLPENLMLSAFYDWGRVKQYVDNVKPSGTVNSDINSYNLSGYGLSLSWLGPYQANIKATWARRIGRNPYPTASGNDQDGSFKRDRYWLSASIPF